MTEELNPQGEKMTRDMTTERYSAEGLTSEEVEARIAEGKVNGEQTVRTKSVAQILRSNILTFFNFVFILLAVLLSGFVPAGMDGIGNFGFLILIVFNTLVGIVQELRAKRTMDKLALLSAPKATVIRDGEEREIAIEEIVLDDCETSVDTGAPLNKETINAMLAEMFVP